MTYCSHIAFSLSLFFFRTTGKSLGAVIQSTERMKGVWFRAFFLSDQKFNTGHIKICQSLLYVSVPLYADQVRFISQSSSPSPHSLLTHNVVLSYE